MRPPEETYFDKSTWGDGPWQGEPDGGRASPTGWNGVSSGRLDWLC